MDDNRGRICGYNVQRLYWSSLGFVYTNLTPLVIEEGLDGVSPLAINGFILNSPQSRKKDMV